MNNRAVYERGPVFDQIESFLPTLRESARKTEQQRRLSDEIVTAMIEIGIYAMAVPREWGGLELNPMEQTRVIELLAMGDASAAWCAMIGSDGGYFAAHIQETAVKELFSDLRAPVAMIVAPSGLAVMEDGAYRVSGRWGFSSGSSHAEVFVLGCRVLEGKVPKRNADGSPQMRLIAVPRDKVKILDTWYTTGLRGSASNDIEVDDVLVPAAHSCDLVNPTPVRQEAMYRHWPIWNANMAGVPLGLAQRAIDLTIERCGSKRLPNGKKASSEAFIRRQVAEATASLRGCRAYAFEALASLYGACEAGEVPTLDQRAHWRLSLSNVFNTCFDVVAAMYKIGGASAIYAERGPMDQIMRDMTTANQHINANLLSYELVGQMFFGETPEALFY